MTYASLLVHLQSGVPNTALLAVAGQIAERFHACAIGIAACRPMVVVSGDGYVCGDVFADDQVRIAADLEAAESEFRSALAGRAATLEWRSEITTATLADYLATEARSADLILTTAVPADAFDLARAGSPGSLVLQAGRPVVVVPADAKALRFEGALIGWKDTRESRRAVVDALPLLGEVDDVVVLEIAALDELDAACRRVNDVVTWLGRHGVAATGRVERADGNDTTMLQRATDDVGADLIVAGAYGHSRLREWVLGGVSRDLLVGAAHCVLVSH